MENEIISYLTKHISLSDELKQIIRDSIIVKSFKKGAILLKEGEFCNESYFVLKGCIRSYTLKNGEDKTLEFYTEEQPLAPIGFLKKTASDNYLECVEDTTVSVSNPEYEELMFKKYPQFESVCRIMSDVMMANMQETLTNYKTDSAEDRYLQLLQKRSSLIQRVPQYHLASYLGVKPETLSRIRKRLQLQHL